MKIGVIYYSETGNTANVAKQLATAFRTQGHQTTLQELTVFDVKTNRSLKTKPACDGYDILIIGSPVQGFSLPLPVQEYLSSIQLPKQQKIGLFTTQFFPFDWMGGKQTVSQFKTLLLPQNPQHIGEALIHWKSRKREVQIANAIQLLTAVSGRASL